MASRHDRRKQEEKNLKLVRELASLPHNRQCFDCHQRGPTYVNMTIGSFVCTSCSGILRGLNPPQRVKSISMTSFTQQEIEFLQSKGNEYCRYVWMALFDSRTQSEPDSKDEQRVKDFMMQKYERKRWYAEPSAAVQNMKQKLPSENESGKSNGHAQTKPLKTLLGNNTPNLIVQNQKHPVAQTQAKAQPQIRAQPQSLSSAPKKSINLLDDLGGDPFASPPAPAPDSFGGAPAISASSAGDGFANFDNQPSLFDSASSSLFGSAPVSSASTNAASSTGAAAQEAIGSDKYSGLEGLFSLGDAPDTGAAGAGAPTSNTKSVSSDPASFFGGGLSSVGGTNPAPSQGGGGSNPFAATNPFQAAPPVSTQAAPAPGMFGAAAFGGSHQQQAPAHPGGFGAPAGQGMFPAQTSNGAMPFSTMGSSPFGGGGGGASGGQWAAGPQQAAPVTYTASVPGPLMANQQNQPFGLSAGGGGVGGWPQAQQHQQLPPQQSFNPFMGAAQATGMRPPMNANNPFL